MKFRIHNQAPRPIKLQGKVKLMPGGSELIEDAAILAGLEVDRVFQALVAEGALRVEDASHEGQQPAPAIPAVPLSSLVARPPAPAPALAPKPEKRKSRHKEPNPEIEALIAETLPAPQAHEVTDGTHE